MNVCMMCAIVYHTREVDIRFTCIGSSVYKTSNLLCFLYLRVLYYTCIRSSFDRDDCAVFLRDIFTR